MYLKNTCLLHWYIQLKSKGDVVWQNFHFGANHPFNISQTLDTVTNWNMFYCSTSESFWINLNPFHGDVVLIRQHQFNLIRIVCLRPAKAIEVKISNYHLGPFRSTKNILHSVDNVILHWYKSMVPEHHAAVLPVKGKIVDFNGAGASVHGRGQPVHAAIRFYQSVSVKGHLEFPIHTVHTKIL